MRRRSSLFLAGALWGLVAWGLGARVYGPALWGGLAAAPFIGVVIGSMTQTRFEGATGWRRWVVALLSLDLGATLFALAVGVTDALTVSAARRGAEVVYEAVLGTWWGLTLTGFLIALWPLAWLTHIVVAWVDES